MTRPFHDFALRLRRSAAAFRDGEDGVAAIEFALIGSLVLVPIWLGFAEVAKMHERSTVLDTTTAMVADMISAYPVVKEWQLEEVLESAAFTVGLDANGANDKGRKLLRMTVRGVVVPKRGTGAPYVAWAMNNEGGSTCAIGKQLPATVREQGTTERFLIVVDGELQFKNVLAYNSDAGYRTTTHRSYFSPRLAASIAGPNPCPKP